jgi:hypothetical protein
MKVGLLVGNTFLDVGADAIPVTFSINDFGELNAGTGDYSTDFEVAATYETRQALGFIEETNVSTRTAYKIQDATLIVGSVEVYGYIQIVSFNRRANTFSLAFFAGNAEWFELAKQVSIKDLDYSRFDHLYTVPNVAANVNNEDGFCYPLIDYGLNETNLYNFVSMGQIFPATYYKEIIKAGFRKIGYKANYPSLLIDQIFTRATIPYSGEGLPQSTASTRCGWASRSRSRLEQSARWMLTPRPSVM